MQLQLHPSNNCLRKNQNFALVNFCLKVFKYRLYIRSFEIEVFRVEVVLGLCLMKFQIGIGSSLRLEIGLA